MSAQKPNGGPAFPTENNVTSDDPNEFLPQPGAWHGMSLRDWFAGQALIGLLGSGVAEKREQSSEVVAEIAYRNADAMLAAREGLL